jgi:hypothetical protein
MKSYPKLDDEFHFDLDPCTTPDNPLQTQVGFTKDDDGLKQRRDFGGSVFVNPLYGKNVNKWVAKAWEENNTICYITTREKTISRTSRDCYRI